MKRTVTFLMFLPLVFQLAASNFLPIPDHQLWPRPVIIPVPDKTAGVSQPVISLTGIWKISTDPKGEYWSEQAAETTWRDIKVPSSVEMQGITVLPDKEYAYQTTFRIPEDYSGKRIIIRFEGVTGTAKTWVNGHFLQEHFGGFNIWNCDITQHVTPGEEAVLTIGITEERERTSSGFNTGGIIRDVRLMALPANYISRFHVETDLDDAYLNGELKVWLSARFNVKGSAIIKLSLKDPQGREVYIKPDRLKLTPGKDETILRIHVADPEKWDAEHPNLYKLEATLMDKGTAGQVVSRNVGFRKVEIRGVKMLVNGREVKLRGGGRFDSDPVYGKYLSAEESYREVKMLKDANLNFVRPSCYPATDDYFDACDKLGLYVQAENAVTFARGSQDNPAHTDIYMNQMAEMIEAHRSHPSIIIWELANETWYGSNIGKTYEYARAEDPSRPVIFSWSQSVPEGTPWPYEIYSYHYPDWDQDLGTPGVAVFNGKAVRTLPEGMPVLHDEFAHGSSYYPLSLDRDPGMRNFWGESIKRFWERMFVTEGCLGGAIWAVIDENAGGSWAYEWGMIDLWRRERPEYWLMKKAYSPVRICDQPIELPEQGKTFRLPVKNWHDHTNLNEITIHWSHGPKTGIMRGPDIEPHLEGFIEFPGLMLKKGSTLDLKFFDQANRCIDVFSLPVSPEPVTFAPPAGPAPAISEDEDRIIIRGEAFSVSFSKITGLIETGTFKGKTLLKGGPYLNLIGGSPLKNWKPEKISAVTDQNEAVVTITGSYDLTDVQFRIRIDGTGLFTTEYTIERTGIIPPEPTKVPWNKQDAGGFEEVGVYYVLASGIDRFSWERNGLWSVYPEDHIGRNKGTAMRHIQDNQTVFGKKPSRTWSLEEWDFSLYGKYDTGGRGTNDFRSMKEYIYRASADISGTGHAVQVESPGTEAVRLEVIPDRSQWIDNNDPRIKYQGRWQPAADTLEYFGEREYRSSGAGNYLELTFNGTGISWVGTMGSIPGSADVYIDGVREAEGLGFSTRGKTGAQSVLFSKTGLQPGEHTLKIVAKPPRRQSQQTNDIQQEARAEIPVDAFAVHNGLPAGGDVKLVINNRWNHTKMGLGNYMKAPIYIQAGHSGKVTFRLLKNTY